ncbi:MAG: MFS transporter [Pseudomonadota bacterium]
MPRSAMATLVALYFFSQFYRAFLSVLYPALARDLGVDAVALSNAQAAWFAVFAAAQLPLGWALDRYGPRRTVALVWAVGTGGGAAAFAAASGPMGVIAAMGLIGLGCAPALMGSLYIIGRIAPAARFAAIAGLIIGLGAMGNVAASAPMAAISEAIGWRAAMLILAAASLAMAVVVWRFAPDPAAPPPPETPRRRRDSGFLAVIRLRALWPILPLAFMNYAPAGALRSSWAGPYFETSFGLDEAGIGRATLAMALGMALGALAYGPLDRWVGGRKRAALAGNALLLTALLWLALAPVSSVIAATAAFVAVGFFGASFPVVMAHGQSFLPPHLLGRGVAFVNCFSVGGAGLMQFWSGGVFERAAESGGAQAGFAAVFGLYAAALALALLVYAFSRERPAAAP